MIEYAGPHKAMIKVIGVGGGGSNAVNSMLDVAHNGNEYVEFICTNTDAQALQCSEAPTKIQLGQQITGGLGAGANPDVGRAAAEEDLERLREVLMGAHMVFIAAGMGGGTGTGAAPVVARVAQELGILTVAVVTRPFSIEGKLRNDRAEKGIEELKEYVDSLITIPNQRLVSIAGDKMTLKDCFSVANKVLIDAVYGIIDLIHEPGLINVDFADVRTVMSQHGSPHALMGTGVARGDNRAHKAAQEAISSPLLSNVNIQGARSLLINFTGGNDMTLNEVLTASAQIKQDMTTETDVIFGAVCKDDHLDHDEIKVTVIATGFDELPQDADQFSIATPPPRAIPTASTDRRGPNVGFGAYRPGNIGSPAPRPVMGSRMAHTPVSPPVKSGMSMPSSMPQSDAQTAHGHVGRSPGQSSSASRPLPGSPSGDRYTGDYAKDAWSDSSSQGHAALRPSPSDPWSDAPPERSPGPRPPRSPRSEDQAPPSKQASSEPHVQVRQAEASAPRPQRPVARDDRGSSEARWSQRQSSSGSHSASVYSQDDRFQSTFSNFGAGFGQSSGARPSPVSDPYAAQEQAHQEQPRSSGYQRDSGGQRSDRRSPSTSSIGSRRPNTQGRAHWSGSERQADEGIEDLYDRPIRRTPSDQALRQATSSNDQHRSAQRDAYQPDELDNLFSDEHELE